MADDIARMRAALNDGSSVTVQGISPEQLAAIQSASKFANASYTQPTPQNPPQEDSLFKINVPSLEELSSMVQKIPEQTQRFLTNPQAFIQATTGKNLLPEQTGFAASTTGLPPENPNSLFTPQGMAYQQGYETGEPIGIASMALPLAGAVAKPTTKMLAEMANRQIMDTGGIKLPMGLPEIPIANYAVKPGGGNWADSRLNMVVDPLKFSIANTPSSQAINSWVDSKLKKYIRNDLAAPNDPVRELADQGISHISNLEDRYTGLGDRMKAFRAKQGFEPLGYSKTNMGHVWENLADEHVYPQNIKDYIGDNPATANKHPWMTDLYMKDPTAQVNEIAMDARIGLGFDHLVDELHNAINKYSDVPQHLRLKPETLDRITVPQAVQHVAKINSWRAEQMAKASKESLNDFPIVHEGSNGYNIHELKLPEEIPANWRQNDNGEWVSPSGDITTNDPRYEMLDKALKNEGQQMGHCVGGYTTEVAKGDSRIFTLRGPNGSAHVTIEAIPKQYFWEDIPESVKDAAQNAIPPHIYPNSQPAVDIQKAYLENWTKNNPKLVIEQIKGKANGAVSEKYRGDVQDFLNKNSNEFKQVKDLENVGLADLKTFEKNPNWSHYATHALKPGELDALGFEFPDALMLKLKELFPSQRFVSLEEIRAALNLPPVSK